MEVVTLTSNLARVGSLTECLPGHDCVNEGGHNIFMDGWRLNPMVVSQQMGLPRLCVPYVSVSPLAAMCLGVMVPSHGCSPAMSWSRKKCGRRQNPSNPCARHLQKRPFFSLARSDSVVLSFGRWRCSWC
jgi:hypothetical protein